ncbi:protein of unknown function [Nitrosomonas sp. PY1]|uniref:DUF4124 domain-containing protein n=1 Tax=Nitrosomonas sp. PY1 TaxID=1803906 RepID=UPI001FC7E3D6|nr:DUF4124 domain-containing protein [Nitrosomonas sp. PY1]GKS69094.1 protein of unknown function [Nitrosomonas sp. PY1]
MLKNKFLVFCLSIGSTLLINTVQAGIYKHVDQNGKVTYSNIPSTNAKQLDLQPIVVMPPPTNSGSIDERIIQRRESMKFEEQRSQLQSKITEEEKRLNEVKEEYKDGVPDRLGSERNYQRYLDRVEHLRKEIQTRENSLNALRSEMQGLVEKKQDSTKPTP